jgi:hypothetical protein
MLSCAQDGFITKPLRSSMLPELRQRAADYAARLAAQQQRDDDSA